MTRMDTHTIISRTRNCPDEWAPNTGVKGESMGKNVSARKGKIYLACTEKLSGSDVLLVSFDREEALEAARKHISSLNDSERENTVFLLSEVDTQIYPVDTPLSAYQRLLTKMGAGRSSHWSSEAIRDGLRTELRVEDNACAFYRDGEKVFALSAPYLVCDGGVLTVQDQVKADICRIQRKTNIAQTPLTHRELRHLTDDLTEYYLQRDQRAYKRSRPSRCLDRYCSLCKQTEMKKRALIASMADDKGRDPWDAEKIAAKLYVPFLEAVYTGFPTLVAGATLFERVQMLDLLEAYRTPGLPFEGYWLLPPEAQMFVSKGGLYGSV